MDTVEYSELLVSFGKGLMRIAEGAEAAADDDIEGAERTRAIDAARKKLADYDGIMARLRADSKVLAGQFETEFKASMSLLRESLQRIDEAEGKA
jgi:hypothetical protein